MRYGCYGGTSDYDKDYEYDRGYRDDGFHDLKNPMLSIRYGALKKDFERPLWDCASSIAR